MIRENYYAPMAQLKWARHNFHARRFALATLVALIGIVTLATPQHADAQEFSADKYICAGDPAVNDPGTCMPVQFVGAGQPAFYVFKVANPPFSGAQQITLDEVNTGSNSPWPDGFTPGTVTCSDQSGNNVPITGTAVGSFQIQPNQTIICSVKGIFSSAVIGADITNNAEVTAGGRTSSVDANVHISSVTQLDTDLSVTKSVVPISINVSTGAKTVKYTVTIQNNGQDVDIGNWFVLHDNLRLLPNSVPFFATVLPGATCTPSVSTTDCLDSTGPTLTPAGPRLIGTMAPVSMFDWGFASGQGFIEHGESITLEWEVEFKQLNGLDCVKAQNSDGVLNQVFFTLTNPDGTAANDLNNANNTTSVALEVITGNTVVNPNCGDGQMSIEKTQVDPAPASGPLPWGVGTSGPGTVTYDIKIKNTSFPNQSITINGGDLRDYVINGIGTPPFTRTFVSMSCTSILASICSGFNGSPPPPVPFPSSSTSFKYTYYGQPDLGWQSNGPLTLPANGDEVTIRVSFNYADPDCDTVPNVDPKLITNMGVISYMATPLGASLGSPQNVQYTQTAETSTFMEPQKACEFVVKKKLSSLTKKVRFSVPLIYDVSFTNNDAPRTIGTVMDVLRLTDPSYASLPYIAAWKCSGSAGMTGFKSSGSVTAGQVTHTNSPAQGAPVMKQPSTIFFPSGSTLTCRVRIVVSPPQIPNAKCAAIDVDLENTALMDVTHPYNSNVLWPPSSSYDSAGAANGVISNPDSQNTNWATVRSLLPKCFDVIINKEASVNGVSPAWTWAGGSPIDYTIKVTNTADNGNLTGSGTTPGNWDGFIVRDDVLGTTYATNPIGPGSPVCSSPWCQAFVPPPASPTPSYAGVVNLASGTSGDWNLVVKSPFVTGESVVNCAKAVARGSINGPDWYANYDPTAPIIGSPRESCRTVPVLDVGELSVTKVVVNQTGAPITIPSLSFGANLSCMPWQLPPTSSTLTTPGGSLANGASVSSSPWAVPNVPLDDQCTVKESTLPPVPNVACSVNGVSGTPYWESTITPTPLQMSPKGQNAVQVTNTLKCEAPPPNCNCDEEKCLFKLPLIVVDGDICITWALLCCLITILLLLLILFLQWIILMRTWSRR